VSERGGNRARGWSFVGTPLDCSGSDRGERRAVGALRDAGIVERLGATDGDDAAVVVDDPTRDPETGVIGFRQIRDASLEIRSSVGAVLERGERPLVVGGDCTILIGILAAVREKLGRVGLAFLDGHADFLDGRTSPSGEAADMDLAVVTGYGAEGLEGLAGDVPMVEPGDVVVLGHREDGEVLAARELGAPLREEDLVDERIQLVEGKRISRGDSSRLGAYVAERLAAQPGRFWVHFDVDVFEERELPAVTYPQPDGLDWQQTEALLRPLVSSPALVGLSVADFDPDKDPDGEYAQRLVALLADML